MFASTQVAAATETARQRPSAGSPVSGSRMWCSSRPPRRQRGEVTVVAGDDERLADRRVDGAVGDAGGAQRRAQRRREERGDRRRGAPGTVDCAQLAVVAEAAARAVDRRELALDGGARG